VGGVVDRGVTGVFLPLGFLGLEGRRFCLGGLELVGGGLGCAVRGVEEGETEGVDGLDFVELLEVGLVDDLLEIFVCGCSSGREVAGVAFLASLS
jgi:hypothetical protein